MQGDRQAGRSSAAGGRDVRAGMGVRAARWTVTMDEADAEDCEVEGESGLLQAVECEGEETGHAVAENDGVLGEAQGSEADGNWQEAQVPGCLQVSQEGGREDGAYRTDRSNDGSDEEDRVEQGAAEVQVSAGAGEDDAEVATRWSVRRVGISFDELMQAALQAEWQVFEDACADEGVDVEAAHDAVGCCWGHSGWGCGGCRGAGCIWSRSRDRGCETGIRSSVNRRDGTDGQDGRTQVDYKLMVKAFRAIAGQ